MGRYKARSRDFTPCPSSLILDPVNTSRGDTVSNHFTAFTTPLHRSSLARPVAHALLDRSSRPGCRPYPSYKTAVIRKEKMLTFFCFPFFPRFLHDITRIATYSCAFSRYITSPSDTVSQRPQRQSIQQRFNSNLHSDTPKRASIAVHDKPLHHNRNPNHPPLKRFRAVDDPSFRHLPRRIYRPDRRPRRTPRRSPRLIPRTFVVGASRYWLSRSIV